MKAFELNNINKLYFSNADIARILGISYPSARVSASRYVKKNVLVRLKRDMYMLTSRISTLTDQERFRLANMIQIPSYISLTTALSHYGVSTQQQQNFIESVALRRTKYVIVKNLRFSYSLIKKECYQGFELNNEFFMAIPEKALADAVYLTSLGRYNCDFHAIDFHRIDIKKLEIFLKDTNRTANLFWSRLCKNFKI